MNGTTVWRKYIEKALQRGWPLMLLAQAYPKEVHQMNEGGVSRIHEMVENEEQDAEVEVNTGTVEQPGEAGDAEDENVEVNTGNVDPVGEADEGERIPQLVNQMRMDDMEYENLSNSDSSDEEGGEPIPGEWNQMNFSNLVVNEGYSVPWDYHENEVMEGAVYKNKDAVRDAVKYWSLSVKRSFVVARSTKKVYDVKCVSSSCPFRVHAYEEKWSSIWKCSIVRDHTCVLHEVEQSNSALTLQFIASYMYTRIVENLRFEPKSIINTIEEDFKYRISYSKAWKAKQKVIKQRFGSYEASYEPSKVVTDFNAEKYRYIL